jgi:CMP/dCMP kinase
MTTAPPVPRPPQPQPAASAPIQITISGDLGSGKSTVGRLIAAQLGVPMKSTGAFQRELAQRRGITTLELNRLAETDPSIDTQIDAISADIETNRTPAVVDSRMAWHFVPSAFKVFLAVDARLAAQRIFEAERVGETAYASVDEVMHANRERRASEVRRFQARYGVNIADHANFDLVIDTSGATPERIAHLVVQEHAEFVSRQRMGLPCHARSVRAS